VSAVVARALSAEDVTRIRRAMARAATWPELLRLAQHIWACPVVPARNGRPSARTRLCIEYARGVERLWRDSATRRRRPRGARRRGIAA
jgi:hypothetical protein